MDISQKADKKIENLIADLGVTPEHFSHYAGIPVESLMNISDKNAQSRCNDIFAILSKVRPWFDSSFEGWSWYISQPIPSFGNITAAEVVKKYARGVEAVNDYIVTKEFGGFE